MAHYCLFLQLRYCFLIFHLQIFVSGKKKFVYILLFLSDFKLKQSYRIFSTSFEFFVRVSFLNFLKKERYMKVDKFCISYDKQLEKRKKDTVYIIYIHTCTN